MAGLAVAGGFIWRSRSSALAYTQISPAHVVRRTGRAAELVSRWVPSGVSLEGRYLCQAGGAEAVVQVTKDPAMDSWPAWSPDGSQIAFVRNGDVFLVSPLGGAERKVAESAGQVAWVPDGSALLVLKKAPPFAQSVFRVSLATGQEQRLTFPKEPSAGDIAMAMSPDSRTLAFCRSALREGCDLFLASSDGAAHKLTNDLKGILGLTWTADGCEVVFASDRSGRFQLWRVSARPMNSGGVYGNPVLVEGAGDDARNPSISRTSRLVYQRFSRNFDIQRVEIAGREGTVTHRLGTPPCR